MARSDITTWLPLSEWGRIMGYNLWELNNFSQWPSDDRSCGSTWFQSSNQTDQVTRDELAQAIQNAETMICDYVGYNLLPTWDRVEITPPRFRVPGWKSNITTFGTSKSVQLPKAHVYALGERAKTAIESGSAITRVDLDGDGFNETARVTIANLSLIDVNEVKVYYPGVSGDDGWEIRPIKISGDSIDFPVYLIPLRNLIDRLDPSPIDPNNTSNFLTTVDVYRVYNDTSNRVTLVYHPDPNCDSGDCSYDVVTDCGYVVDPELGYVVYNPSLYTEPDQLWINYYSGYRANLTRSLVELDPYWKTAVTYLAAGLLDKELHGCCGGSDPKLKTRWQERLDLRTVEGGHIVTNFMVENPFGILTTGSWYAYQRAVARRL